MIIEHPVLGPRDLDEFTYFGDASLMFRPDGNADKSQHTFHDYVYLRDNVAGYHDELWYHEHGDRSWLIVTRHTVTHEISQVKLAHEVARKER